jgi:SNF2 family DNA or RNA helicase
MSKNLFPFQQEAVNKFNLNNYVLADKCGLGKTLVALQCYVETGMDHPCIVVTRKNNVWGFAQEAEEYFNGNVVIHAVRDYKKFPEVTSSSSKTLVVLHYEMLAPLFKYVFSKNKVQILWDLIVVDEAHKIKNKSTQITVNVKKLIGLRKIALSATPTHKNFQVELNGVTTKLPSPSEIWSLLNWLYPNTFRSFFSFRNKYVELNKHPVLNFVSEIGIKNVESYARILSGLFLQRTKEQVVPELPKLIESKVVLEMTEKQKRWYTQLVEGVKKDALVFLEDLSPEIILNKMSEIVKLQRITSFIQEGVLDPTSKSVKLQWLKEMFLEDNPDESLLVYTKFRDTAEAVSKLLDIPFVQKGEEISSKPSRMVMTIDFASGALNLPWITNVVYVDIHWSTISMEQSRDRVHRINITEPKQMYYLICKGTVDELVYTSFRNNWSNSQTVDLFLKSII